MAAAGINIQYCMPWARHIPQSSKHNNVTTIRPSDDRFERQRWRIFYRGSRISAAVGLWPWSDTFNSSEHGSLVLSLLTGGIMGSGDALNTPDFASIRRAIRSDSVLIEPTVTASTGTVGAVTYSSTTKLFTVSVTAAGTSSTVHVAP